MNKIISFCLWGNNPKYLLGAIKNIELAKKFFPDWKCRFYIDSELISNFSHLLDDIEVFIMFPKFEGWRGMFARFLPASDPSVDVFISRDCDSRLSEREALAVQEWLESDKLTHSMADHPHHFHPLLGLMGGMIGFKKGAIPQMSFKIDSYLEHYPNEWQCDQSFLRDWIMPTVRYSLMAHSDMHQYCKSFPKLRQGLEFVGKVYDFKSDGEEFTIKEHEDVLQKYIKDQGFNLWQSDK